MAHDHAYILDILRASKKIIRVTTGMQREQFDKDDVVQDSVIRQKIAWREMVGMRNRLIHDYSDVNLAQVWKTIREDIPGLIRLIEPLVPPEE